MGLAISQLDRFVNLVKSSRLLLSKDPFSVQADSHATHLGFLQFYLIDDTNWVAPVRCATTANVALSTNVENGDTIDGVTLGTGDSVLIKNQTVATENGIYTVNASGPPTRRTDFDNDSEIDPNVRTYVYEGTANADKAFYVSSADPHVPDTNDIDFAEWIPPVRENSQLPAKISVRVATTTNGALATAYENGDTVDGITLATNDRILLKDQTAGAENGIYVVQATGAPVRAVDADESDELISGLSVFVQEGDINGGKNYQLTTTGTITPDTTSLTFAEFAASGVSPWKVSVRAATTAAGTLATDYENADTLDGVTLATNDRILIKDQAAGAENGLYVVQASGAPVRALDADEDAEVFGGLSVFVSEGTSNGNKVFRLTTDDPITVGSTALTFAQDSGGATDVDSLTEITAAAKGDIIYRGASDWENKNVSELTELSTMADDDWSVVHDTSAGELKKISPANMSNSINSASRRMAFGTADGTQTGIDATTETAIEFATENYDVGGWFDPGVSETLFTVPDGVTKIDAQAWVVVTNATSGEYVIVSIKGSSAGALARQRIEVTDATQQITLSALGAAVTAGETITVVWQTETDTITDISNAKFHVSETIETIGAGTVFNGAKVDLTANLSLADYTTATAIAFDDEDFDTHGWHDTVTNNTRLTVPSGVTKVQLTGYLVLTSATATEWVQLQILKNGTTEVANTRLEAGGTTPLVNVSALDECTATDYYELLVRVEADTSTQVLQGTWFAVQAVESTAVASPTRTTQNVSAQTTVSVSIPDGCTRVIVTSELITMSTSAANFNVNLYKTGDTVNTTVGFTQHQMTASTLAVSNTASGGTSIAALGSLSNTDRAARCEILQPRNSGVATTFNTIVSGESAGTDQVNYRFGVADSASDDDTIRILVSTGTYSGDIHFDWFYV